jgi:hypothetical protein
LPDDYIIFYDVNLFSRNNIDFVILGSCGVLAIEVKSHKGRITFNDGKLLINGFEFKKGNPIKQVKENALDLNYYLKEKIKKDIFVTPILVFSNKYTSMRFGLKTINNAYIIQKYFLLKLIYSLPIRLEYEEIRKIEKELIECYKQQP